MSYRKKTVFRDEPANLLSIHQRRNRDRPEVGGNGTDGAGGFTSNQPRQTRSLDEHIRRRIKNIDHAMRSSAVPHRSPVLFFASGGMLLDLLGFVRQPSAEWLRVPHLKSLPIPALKAETPESDMDRSVSKFVFREGKGLFPARWVWAPMTSEAIKATTAPSAAPMQRTSNTP